MPQLTSSSELSKIFPLEHIVGNFGLISLQMGSLEGCLSRKAEGILRDNLLLGTLTMRRPA